MACEFCENPLSAGEIRCPYCGTRQGIGTAAKGAMLIGKDMGKPSGYPGTGRPDEFRLSCAALVSVCAGILGWTAFPFGGALVAVLAGHHARRSIRHAGGGLVGGTLAMTGLVLGYTQLMLVAALLGLVLLAVFVGLGLSLLAFAAVLGLSLLPLGL